METCPLSCPTRRCALMLAGMRELAGTNPAMATGGFTGRRGGAGGGGGGRGAGAAAATATPAPAPARGAAPAATPQGTEGLQPATIKMADGKVRTGLLLAQSECLGGDLREQSLHVFSKDGDAYREKTITPKSDWTHYDGSLTGNRYSPLELINPTNVQRLGAAWVFPIASNPRALQSTPVVQDGIMYVTGWNEIYALDATTGRQLWTYSEARHEGILSEGGIGTNRGVTISGDKAFMVTDHAHLAGLQSLHGTEALGRGDGLARRVLQLDLAPASRRRPDGRRRRRAARKALADSSMPIARQPASASGAGTRFRSAARKARKPGSARRSSMAAARRGCPARTIRSSI